MANGTVKKLPCSQAFVKTLKNTVGPGPSSGGGAQLTADLTGITKPRVLPLERPRAVSWIRDGWCRPLPLTHSGSTWLWVSFGASPFLCVPPWSHSQNCFPIVL